MTAPDGLFSFFVSSSSRFTFQLIPLQMLIIIILSSPISSITIIARLMSISLTRSSQCQPQNMPRQRHSSFSKRDINSRHGEVLEWLIGWTANPMGSARVSSNLILVELKILFLTVWVRTVIFCDGVWVAMVWTCVRGILGVDFGDFC
jgi:hypothetical protein